MINVFPVLKCKNRWELVSLIFSNWEMFNLLSPNLFVEITTSSSKTRVSSRPKRPE